MTSRNTSSTRQKPAFRRGGKSTARHSKGSNAHGAGANGRRSNAAVNPKSKFDHYIALARAAANSDPIDSENYYQHAEHYFRLMRETGA